MFKVKTSIKARANTDRVWNLYENVSLWNEWDDSISKVTLNGNFIDNTEGTIFFSDKNTPPLKFILSDVKPNKSFTTSSFARDISIKITHNINELEENITIDNTIEITGKDENMINNIGNNLCKQIENSTKKLLLLAIN